MKIKNFILALVSIFLFSAAHSQDSTMKRSKNRMHKSDTSWNKGNNTMQNNRSRKSTADTGRMHRNGMHNAARKPHNTNPITDSTKR